MHGDYGDLFSKKSEPNPCFVSARPANSLVFNRGVADKGWFAQIPTRVSSETADALASGASVRKDVGVQVPLAHQTSANKYT